MNLEGNTSVALIQAAQGGDVKPIEAIKRTTSGEKKIQQFDEVAQDFEAMFMTEMLKPMFAELKPDPRFGGGKGEEIFSGMMLQEYGKMMAETRSLGIADAVKAELIRMQDTADNKPSGTTADINAYVSANENNKTLDNILEEQINAQ